MGTGGTKKAQPHDALVRAVLGNPVDASSVVRSFLPPAVIDSLDFDNFERQPGTFVTEELSGRHADLLFRTTVRGGEQSGDQPVNQRDAYIYVLIEHQSTPDQVMAYRMAGYQQRIWDRHVAERGGTTVPLVVPIVIYQGRQRWDVPTDVADLIDIKDDYAQTLGDYLPRIQYHLINLTNVDDDALRARPLTPAARVALVSLRRAPGDDDVTVWLVDWREEIATISDQNLIVLVSYLVYVGNTPEEKLRAFAATTGPHTEEIIMTTAEQLHSAGIAEGQAQLLLKQLTTRYGNLDPDLRERVENATTEEIELWSVRLIQGTPALDDIFA